jgi:hypothetical protein
MDPIIFNLPNLELWENYDKKFRENILYATFRNRVIEVDES